MKKKIILDTSLFVNPAAASQFGPSPTLAFMDFLDMAKHVTHAEFFMPPSIYAELMNFVDETKIPRSSLLLIHKASPKRHELKIPGIFIYQLVETMRDRIDRGLRLAERHVRESFQKPVTSLKELHSTVGEQSQEFNKASVRADAESISRLRESYRRIMREGMLDSKADVDLLLLAYEVDGTLVSADEGVIFWADNLGITTLDFKHLHEFLLEQKVPPKP